MLVKLFPAFGIFPCLVSCRSQFRIFSSLHRSLLSSLASILSILFSTADVGKSVSSFGIFHACLAVSAYSVVCTAAYSVAWLIYLAPCSACSAQLMLVKVFPAFGTFPCLLSCLSIFNSLHSTLLSSLASLLSSLFSTADAGQSVSSFWSLSCLLSCLSIFSSLHSSLLSRLASILSTLFTLFSTADAGQSVSGFWNLSMLS